MRFGIVRLILLILAVVLAGSTVAWAAPPARPVGLTAEQFQTLQRLETQPPHRAVLEVHATYKSERERSLDFTRASDDFWTIAMQAGFPGTIAAFLIAAAPL